MRYVKKSPKPQRFNFTEEVWIKLCSFQESISSARKLLHSEISKVGCSKYKKVKLNTSDKYLDNALKSISSAMTALSNLKKNPPKQIEMFDGKVNKD